MPERLRERWSASGPVRIGSRTDGIVGRLTCEAFEKDGQRGYRFAGQGTYEPLLPGKLVPTYVLTPGGYSEGWNASLTFCIAGVALAA